MCSTLGDLRILSTVKILTELPHLGNVVLKVKYNLDSYDHVLCSILISIVLRRTVYAVKLSGKTREKFCIAKSN
jgi:hypothetical protein